jgi:enoyl-CoA hydratase/carnithine racemase
MPPARLGLVYGHTGLRRFIDVVGVARTKELFLTGLTVEGPRAEEIGLVHAVVDDHELPGTALELAETIAANAPISMRGNKEAIETLAAFPRLTSDQERHLVELREACFRSEDFREGIQAFGERRRPRWTGK